MFAQIELLQDYHLKDRPTIPKGSIGKILGTNLKLKESVILFPFEVSPSERAEKLWKEGVIRAIPSHYYKIIGRTK